MASIVRFVGAMDRVLLLRSLPNMDTLGAADLAGLATVARERPFRRGDVLQAGGVPARCVHALAEGSATLRWEGKPLRRFEAPFGFGLHDVLGGGADTAEVVAETPGVTLEIPADEVLELLEDNFQLLHRTLLFFAGEFASLQRSLELRGLLPRGPAEPGPYPERPLGFAQRLALVRRRGPFWAAGVEPLAQLVRRQPELRVEPGTVLWRAGDPSGWGGAIVHGVVRCVNASERREFRLGRESALGLSEALTGAPRPYDAVAETRLVLLRSDGEALLDVFEDSPELGLSFARFQASNLVRLRPAAAALAELEGAADALGRTGA